MGSAKNISLQERFWRAVPDSALWSRFMQLLGHVGIRKYLKRTYCRLFGPNGGIVTLRAGGLETNLYVHAQYLADSLERLQGEGPMLEFMIRTLRSGDCTYDVGAERGLFSLFLAKAVGESGQVIAFEPFSEAYEYLEENITLNGLRNIRIVRTALSNYDGRARLFSGAPGYAPTLRDFRDIGVQMPVSTGVAVAKGDSVVQEMFLPLPRAIKIDAEGCELDVIEGLSQTLAAPTCQLLCCEIHPAQLPTGVTLERIVARIKSLKFTDIEMNPRGETFHAICRKPT